MSVINWNILYINDPLKGRPLFNGKIFVGEPDLDPEIVVNQKQLNVVQEDGTVVAVPQPFILSAGGVPMYNGSPVRLDVDGNFSIKILDRNDSQTYYIENIFEGQPVTVDDLDQFYIDKKPVLNFTLLDDAVTSTDTTRLYEGAALNLKERTAGNGGGAMWDVVLTSSVTPNGSGIVQSSAIPALSFVIRDSDVNAEAAITDAIQTMNGFTDIEPDYITELKSLGDIAIDSDSATIKKKSIKAWKKPTGIKDSAVAASFMLNDGVNEPSTQVSGFVDIDAIGIQQSRDAVAVFGQVDSAEPLLVTSNATYTATTIVSPDFAAIWDKIEVGLICDVNFGTAGWVGAVVTSKTNFDTLNIQTWRNIDGVSGLATTPTDFSPLTIDRHNAIWGGNFNAIIPTDGGANQAIGIEVGVQCVKTGTGANSKGFLAVAFPGGERPEFGYSLTGLFGKGYTSQDCNIYGFSSIGDKVGLDVIGSTENAIQTEDPTGHHIECRDSTSASQFIVTKEGLVGLGKNVESGNARLNIRGDGLFANDYDETEVAIFDPTTTLIDREGFYITQEYLASSSAGAFNIGVKSTSNHLYQLYVQTEGVNRIQFHSNGHIYAGIDNTQSMGTAGKRWSEIFAANGVINTSDEREKTPLTDFTEAEARVAAKLKQLIKTYKWKESVKRETEGGKKARVHVGIGAQSLGQTFTDEGLDPNDYAMFCFDEWETEDNIEAGDRYGVRLDQVTAFIIANT